MAKAKNDINPLALKPSKKSLEDMSDDEFFEHIEKHDTADYWEQFDEAEDVTIKRPQPPDKKGKS